MDLDKKIEAILFYQAEPFSIKKLAEILKQDESSIKKSLQILEENLNERGIVLVQNGDKVMLGTNPELSDLIAELNKGELNKELGKAGLETLSIILYRGPISKKEIDYIRGVNSGYILRNLLIRGLIEKTEQKLRSAYYRPTLDLLAHMGVKKIEELPEFENIKTELESLKVEENKETESE